MTDDALLRELAYYKRHLDELAAARIATEHRQWALHAQLRQKKQGFQLLSKLARSVGTQTELPALLRMTALQINSELAMDRTIVFLPSEDADRYAPAIVVGLSETDADELSRTRIELPAELRSGSRLVLANLSSEPSPTIAHLRALSGLASFVCLPVADAGGRAALLLSGRLREDATFCPALDQGDVDTFRAIVGVLEASLQHTHLARLEQVHRLKTELFANVSHELRTPLTLTMGPLAQILDGRWGDVPPAVRDRLQVVERNQARLLGLVNEILDLARLESGAELRAAPIAAFNDLVRECAGDFRLAAEARGVRLTLSLDPLLDALPIVADREKIERLLFNLLSNALKYTDDGHVEVATRKTHGSLEMVVSDTGVGISPDELPRIFARFGRAPVGDRRLPGTGIGLALVQEIAQMHGGGVRAESQKGKGSRFVVTLPLGDASAQAGRGHEASPPSSGRVGLGRHRQKADARQAQVDPAAIDEANRCVEASYDPSKAVVLYVEDDADMIEHVRLVMGDDCNLFVAGDGVSGLSAARRYLPDAIVADHMMPRMNGRELLCALRSETDLQSIPFVILTASYGAEGRIESLAAGADDYITKPFHDVELLVRVRNLIRARAHQRQLAKLNRQLEARHREESAEISRSGEMKRFLPPSVVATLARGGFEREACLDGRRVCVLVANAAGMHASADQRDASALCGVWNEYLDAVASIAGSRGATIDSLAAGRVSMLFGAPEPADEREAALSAAQAALEIRARVAELAATARRRGVSMSGKVRIGLASGACLVGVFGGDSLRAYTAIGPTADHAASLQASAEAGQIRCAASIRELLGEEARLRRIAGSSAGSSAEVYELLETHASARPSEPVPPSVTASPPLGNRAFRREGDYWTVKYGGSVCRLRNAKGIGYLAQLLARPGREIHVLELVGACMESGDAGPLLDREAKKAYRKRLGELRQALEVARDFEDTERIAQLEAEAEMLARELSVAVGLGGRDRKTRTTVERARVNVTRAVKSTIAKIAASNRALASHLTVSVRTGTLCSYSTHPGVPDSWDLG